MSRRNYTKLSPPDLADEFRAVARDAVDVFGRYDSGQLNWTPAVDRWSVAQCFDHLVKSETEMSGAVARALDPAASRTLWQRLPLWPRLFGRLLVTSMSPDATRTFAAPATAVPAASDIPAAIVDRFVACQARLAAAVDALAPDDAPRVMVSPFMTFVTYSVLDGYRLIAAHQRRHFNQARRVTESAGFPAVT